MENLTALQAAETIRTMRATEAEKRALLRQWNAGVPGARFIVANATGKRYDRIRAIFAAYSLPGAVPAMDNSDVQTA